MTTPEQFRKSHSAIVRGRFHADASEKMFEAAQKAIEDTRRLLEEVASGRFGNEEQPE